VGNSPASEFYIPAFRNTLFIPSSYAGRYWCSETSVYKIQTPGNEPEESIQHSKHGEILKSRNNLKAISYVNTLRVKMCKLVEHRPVLYGVKWIIQCIIHLRELQEGVMIQKQSLYLRM
jgi:hypothetical protein